VCVYVCVPNEAWENHRRHENGHYDALPLNSSAGPCQKRHPIHMCDMSRKYAWHGVFLCVYIRMTFAYISYMHMMFPCVCLHTCVTWRFHTCDTTSAFLFYGWFISVSCSTLWFFTDVLQVHSSAGSQSEKTSDSYVWHVSHTYILHDVFICDTTPSQVRRDWFSCKKPSNPHDSIAHLNIWHDAFIW